MKINNLIQLHIVILCQCLVAPLTITVLFPVTYVSFAIIPLNYKYLNK